MSAATLDVFGVHPEQRLHEAGTVVDLAEARARKATVLVHPSLRVCVRCGSTDVQTLDRDGTPAAVRCTALDCGHVVSVRELARTRQLLRSTTAEAVVEHLLVISGRGARTTRPVPALPRLRLVAEPTPGAVEARAAIPGPRDGAITSWDHPGTVEVSLR